MLTNTYPEIEVAIFLSINYSHLKHNSVQRNLPFIKMAFIKEESEEMKIEEAFSVKEEDTEEQTGWFLIKGELGHCILLMLTTCSVQAY